MIWDDAAVYGSGLLYRYNADNAMVLKALMDTIGTRVRLLFLTCPDMEGLMKFLRRYQDYLINIEVYGKTWGWNGRLATVLKPYRKKNLSRGWRRAFNDEYNVRIENWVYEKYVELRDSYADTIIKELLEYGKGGKEVVEANFGQEQLVGQDNLQSDLVQSDTEGF